MEETLLTEGSAELQSEEQVDAQPGMPTDTQSDAPQPDGCANCGRPAQKDDHPTLLCQECRDHFTRFPIPSWIWIFAGAIGVTMLFSLYTLPKNLSLGIHLERGKKAEKERNYLTAQREFNKIIDVAPGNVDLQSNLAMAAFYNQDFKTFGEQMTILFKEKPPDNELPSGFEAVLQKSVKYFENDSFTVFKARYPGEAPDTAWATYLQKNPDDILPHAVFAGQLMDRKEFGRADSLLQHVLKVDDENFLALMSEASLHRQQKDFAGANAYCDRLLAVNHESVNARSSQVRTLLMQRQDRPALKLALESYGMDDQNTYAIASLILAYHFNGRMADRDALISKARREVKDTAESQIKFALDVIDQKEKFRD